MLKIKIILPIIIIGIGGYVASQYFPMKPLELPVVSPVAPSAGSEWVKNMMDTFHITVTSVSLPSISVDYANLPPSGVNVVSKETGTVVWRQMLTDTDGMSGSTVITLPRAITNSSAYSGEYVLQAFGPDGYVYATSLPFSIGEKEVASGAQLSMEASTEPNQVSEGGTTIISWSSVGATGCYLSSPSEKRNEIGVSGSSGVPVYRKSYARFFPMKIVCYDRDNNEVSKDLNVTLQ